jgi:hypothetical protein
MGGGTDAALETADAAVLNEASLSSGISSDLTSRSSCAATACPVRRLSPVRITPALAAASVGIAMGGGTDAALETADAAVLNERVAERNALAVTSTVAPVSARMAGHRPVMPRSVVTRNTTAVIIPVTGLCASRPE